METVNTRMQVTEWALLVLLSMLWGGSFFFVGIAVKSLPPLTIVTLRVGLAALALYVVLRVLGMRMPQDRRLWLLFLVMSLLNNSIPFSLIVWGQTHIASGLASILNATAPLFTILVAHIFTRDEKLTLARALGILTGFAGVAVIFGFDALQFNSGSLALLAILGAALSYAIAGVFGRRFRTLGIKPMVVATGQVTTATICLIPIVLLVDHPWNLPVPGWQTGASILALALFSTALAYIIYFRLLSTAGATNLLLVTFLIPVSAIVLGALFLNEQLELKHFFGMVLIGMGLVMIDGRIVAGLHSRGSCQTKM